MQHLGPAYVAELRALLDPASHRMDLATERGDRSQDAFSVSAPGVPAMLFVGVRSGDLEAMSRSPMKLAMPCMASGCSGVMRRRCSAMAASG